MIGCLYIVSNFEMYEEDCFKIGFTNDLQRRLKDFNQDTINIGEFKEYGHIVSREVESVEKKVHNDLSNFRVRHNREFFKCDLGTINTFILKNSKEVIIENNLQPGYFCSPQGEKYRIFFESLQNIAINKKIDSPPKPGNDCINGPFCGCITYIGKSHKLHSENWKKILNWLKKNNLQKELDDFLFSLTKVDKIYSDKFLL